MKMNKILTGALFVMISAASVFSADEPVKADAVDKKDTNTTEKKDDSSFEVKALIQVRAVSGQANSGFATPLAPGQTYSNTTTQNDFQSVDFNFRRLRLAADYQINKMVGAVLDLKGENLIGQPTAATTKIGGIQEAIVWFKPGFLGTTIKAGQFKLPFSRELASSSTNHIFAESSYVTSLIQENDIGLYLMTQPLELMGNNWGKKLDIMLSLTNGDGAADVGNGAKKAEFNGNPGTLAKMLNWRVQINPFGGPEKDGKEMSWKDGEEIFSDKMLLSLGAAGAYTSWEGQQGKPLGTDAFSSGKPLHAHTFDATFFGYGIYLNGEYTFTSGNNVVAYQTYQASLGYNLKLGSMYLMPVVRYDYQQSDANKNSVIDDSEKQSSLWIGADLFAIKHNLKFQAFYNILNNAASSKDATKALGKNVIYFQIQSAFGKKV
ncbi:MAG: OprO/OprP family phosphate-selective porin [Spirochaetia bacterium]|nr:OprO/OprP family phosphate-selective porin [Spirochaetia bacterium]